MADSALPSRRRFHIGFIYGLWSALSASLGVPALIYLFFPPRSRQREDWVEVTDVAKLAPKQPEEVIFRRNRKDGWKMVSEKTSAWIAKVSDNEVIAFAPQCTHLGCAYHWDDKSDTFICPCHTSAFSLDGKVLSGPAPRPLDRYNVRMDGSKIFLGAVVESQEGE